MKISRNLKVTVFFLSAALVFILTASTGAEEDLSPYDIIEQMIDEADYKKAEDLLHDRLITNEKDVVAISMLGEVYRLKGNRNKALEMLDKAIKIDPDYPDTYFILAKTYLNMQNYPEADARAAIFTEKMKPFLDKGSPAFKYYLRALHYLSSEYLLLKRYDAFRSGVDEILRLDPQDQSAYYNLGVYYYQYKHDRQSAYKAFEKSLNIAPDTPTGLKARYAIEFIRANPDSRVAPDFSFINQEFSE